MVSILSEVRSCDKLVVASICKRAECRVNTAAAMKATPSSPHQLCHYMPVQPEQEGAALNTHGKNIYHYSTGPSQPL